ncbi:RNA-dependent RNA polymerase [Grapevine associated cogu-like virus 4]|uniref:RNA-directed RNA polymerase L n=2 Tax=Phenuiviridae TaxID=1980418 RepID=A0A7D7EXD7_9VIRU|nr:RNA-dependent RNA polymerase [Grapevine associated cogu-like virus 4]QMP81963.1 RNA-dependent RNA polymerase [Grapevine associated cogu-like virus 4]QXV72600.1 MAG: RNA-dependent RNA polymerase [Grapevine-associated phenui-like virus 1]
MIRFKYFANRVGSPVSVKNLIKFESTAVEYELTEPKLYLSEAKLPETEVSTWLEGDGVNIKIGNEQVSYDRHDKKLKSFLHDYVSSCWTDKTDAKLGVLGVEGNAANLTPDYIIKGTKCVLEVGTCGSDSEKSISNMFSDKVIKYQGELQQIKAKYFILIVSPQKVLTNAHISQDFVDLLTIRMRHAMPVRHKLIALLGEDVMDDEFSEFERLTKSMFNVKVPHFNLDKKYMYNEEDIKGFSLPLTNSEAVSAARILLSRFEDTKNVHSASREDLDNYLSKFGPGNTRTDQKRISNVPLLIPGIDQGFIDTNFDGQSSLSKIWNECTSRAKPSPREISLEDVLKDSEIEFKHQNKKSMLTKVFLSHDDQLEASLSGVGAKAHQFNPNVIEHEAHSKLSFHPLTDTRDIEDFTSLNLMTIDGTENKYMTHLLHAAVVKSKQLMCGNENNLSLDLWNRLLGTDIMKYSMMMTNIFTELAYTYKHWTQHYEFLYKQLEHGVKMIIYNPKSTLFVSFAFPKHGSKLWDRGRLGPKIYTSSSHYFTDWSSFDNSQLEHFIKFGPYIGSCIVDLMNTSKSQMDTYSKYTVDCVPHILLLYCNNKTDVEELVTSQRYLFMKLLEDVGKSPYTFVDRFPKVLRSRLTAFYLKKTISMMDYYSTTSITKVPRQGEEMILYDYMNLKSLFSTSFVSLHTKINEFYFGYVVSKERNTGKDKTFKVLTKLIKQEHKFRDQMEGSMFTEGEEFKEFKSNGPLLKFFSSAFSDLLVAKFGKEYKDKIYKDFVHQASRKNFTELATLKVSARDHSKEVSVPLGGNTTQEVFEQMKKDFPEEMMKRPFCMESMTQIIKEYEEDTKTKIKHLSQLAPWCLKSLMNKGYFDSDQFDKSQHGGEREIHVLEFKARIIQFFVELISRVICSYFPSETTVNPETKDRFVKDHYAKSKEMFGNKFTTISKSADASTWCQFHHTSHFAAMFQAILPEELRSFTTAALSLWPRKRLSFPMKQVSSLAANLKLQTDNTTYMRFKSEFEKGEGMFVQARGNLIEVISGMFQGILHTTSSLYHTMIQEVMKQVMLTACAGRLNMPKILITICQGSDDSGCMITVPGKPTMRVIKLVKRLLLWKERVSPYLSVFCNEAKSSIGTHDLIEYNSEWHVRHMVIKPTFRWVSASQELSVTERFIDRFRIYNNMLTECLTGGASTMECSVIQLFQATMHYCLMGLQSSRNMDVKMRYLENLLDYPEPVHGFFPFDEDVSCGIPGVEFQLYRLYQRSNFGSLIKVLGETETSMDYSPEDMPSWMKVKDLSSVRLKFSNMKVFYRVLERMNLEPLEQAIKAIEDDPEILFSRTNSWTDEQHNLVLKVFSKGVKESISNKSSMLRMASASAYMLTNKCFTDSNENQLDKATDNKHTLLHLMESHKSRVLNLTSRMNDVTSLFPFHEEYAKLSSDIDNLKHNSIMTDQYIKRTSKTKIVVIPKAAGEVDAIDMCKGRWFNFNIPSLSTSQFKLKWQNLIGKFPFISDMPGIQGLRNTAASLGLNIVQTKLFLESMSLRSRSIVLYDSTSKSGNLSFSLSRIYWPNKKLQLPSSNLTDKISELRGKLFSLVTYWYTNSYASELVKELILNSLVLDQPHTMIPSHGVKLKIIHEVLRGVANHHLVHRIEASKKGMLGSYVQIQSGKGNKRKGPGIWQGTMCGIGTRIHMMGNECSHFVLNNLYDTVNLGWTMNQFLNESSLDMPNKSTVNKTLLSTGQTNCWLTHDGKIVVSREQRGIPVYQDVSMRVVGLEETANMQWYVDVNNNNIRIRARDPVSSDLLTILSDTLTNRDWTTGLDVDTTDPVFSKWSRGEAVHMPTLELMVRESFPSTRHEFYSHKEAFEKGKLNNKYNWDYKKLQKIIRDSIIKRGYNSDELKKGEEEKVIDDSKVLSRFSAMLDSVRDEFEIDLDNDIEDWAAEVDMEEDLEDGLWGINLTLEEEVELKNSINLFSEVSGDLYFELIDKADLSKNFSMPSAARFFSPLEHLNMVMNNETLRTSLLNQRYGAGFLGVFYTICIGKYQVGRDDGLASEVIDIEEEISHVSSSISRPGALLSLSLDEIRIHIANISHQLEASSISVSRRLERLLGIYKDREEEILNRIDPRTHDTVILNSSIILDQLMTHMSREHLLPVDISNLDDVLKKNIFTTLVRTEVSSSNKVSSQEKDELTLQLTSNSISRGTIQTISIVYDFDVFLGGEVISNTKGSRTRLVLTI